MGIIITKENVKGTVEVAITEALGLSDYKAIKKPNGEIVIVTMDGYLIKIENK
jgi:hypothetical protein